MYRWANAHPFLSGLVKRAIKIVFTWNIVVVCLIASFIFLAGFAGASMAEEEAYDTTYKTLYGNGDTEFLSIKISGTILGSNDSASDGFGGLFGESATYGYDVKDQLMSAADSEFTKGVILEIDSPGGTIYGARAIADGVKYYKDKTKKPVYAHIEGVGASGAYWAAASADKIYADYGSDIGSIGVIMGPFEYYDRVVATDGGILGGGVVTQNGIQSTTITAGTSKDIGNPYRKLTTEELNKLQTGVNNEYENFVKYVSDQRKIPVEEIKANIGAMAYDTQTAQTLRLTDATGSRQDAYDGLAKAAGVGKDDYYVTREETEYGFFASLMSAVARKPKTEAKLDLCPLTRSPLAYHGDVTAWCGKK